MGQSPAVALAELPVRALVNELMKRETSEDL